MQTDLQRLADRFYAWRCRAHPTTAHMWGEYEHIDQIEDLSRQAEDAHLAELTELLADVRALAPASLGRDDSITAGILLHEIEAAATPLKHRMLELAADPFTSAPAVYLRAIGSLRLTEDHHAEAMLVKWTKLHGVLGQAVQRLKQGAAKDRLPARAPVEAMLAQIDRYRAHRLTTTRS